ncbi:TMPRSS11D isoform 3, partial [Pan troglodytes]
MKSRIESVLQQMLNNSGNLEINPSTEITSLTDQAAANWLINGHTVPELRQGQVRIISNDVCNAP